MTLDQDETMLHLQRLMTAALEIHQVLASHTEVIAPVLATHKNRTIWIDDLERTVRAIEICIQRSKEIMLERAKTFDHAAIRALGREVKEVNRKDRELEAKAKRGCLSEEEKRRILKDYLK